MSRATTRLSWPRIATAIALAALVVRARVALTTSGHRFDMGCFADWGAVLRDHPAADFYQYAKLSHEPPNNTKMADHLPGDLYLHQLLVTVCGWFGIAPGERGYVLAIKAVGSLADVAVAALAALLVHRATGSRRAATITALVLWAGPGWVMVASEWGQWDSVSVALFLGGVVLLGTRAWVGAPLLFAWACLIKPQLGLAVVLCCLAWAVAGGVRSAVRRLAVVAVGGAVSVLALCAPYGTGLTQLGASWSLIERMTYASNVYRWTTLGAANAWRLRRAFDDTLVLGMTLRTIGHIGLAVCLLVLLVRWWRLRRHTTWLGGGTWLAAMGMWALYICETRCHERYFVPAATLLVVHAGLTRWNRREGALAAAAVAMLSGILATHLGHRIPGLTTDTQDDVLGAVNCLLLLVALVVSRPAVAAGTRPTDRRPTDPTDPNAAEPVNEPAPEPVAA